MKESTKTEEVKIVEITKESLSNLSKGYFRIPINTDQTEGISTSPKMREYWGVPRPFGVEFGDSLIEEGFLYLWVRESITVLYLAKKFKPTMLQKALGNHPNLLIKTRSIPHSCKEEVLIQVTQLLGQWSKRYNEGGFPSSFFF